MTIHGLTVWEHLNVWGKVTGSCHGCKCGFGRNGVGTKRLARHILKAQKAEAKLIEQMKGV